MESNDLKNRLERLSSFGYTQKEAVFNLMKNGFDEKEIQKEIYNIYPKLTKESIKKSFSFRFSIFVITLLSFLPISGLYLQGEFGYLIFSATLLAASFGFYKLNKICIWIWIILASFLVLYFLISLFCKMSGNAINSLYSYSFIFSTVLFSGAILLIITDVYIKNKKLNQQYIFDNNKD